MCVLLLWAATRASSGRLSANVPIASARVRRGSPTRRSSEEDAAVNVDRCAGEVGSVRRRQEGDRRYDLRGVSRTAERNFVPFDLLHLLEGNPTLLGFLAERGEVHRGRDISRRHRIDPDIVGGQFIGCAVSERDEGRLGGAIGAEKAVPAATEPA